MTRPGPRSLAASMINFNPFKAVRSFRDLQQVTAWVYLTWLCFAVIQHPIMAASDQPSVNSEKPSPSHTHHRILFIGNSLTYRNNGIYFHLEKLAASADMPVPLETAKCVQGGATLKVHWERPEPRAMVASGGWTEIVVQEDLPEINVSYFREYARRFVEEIRKTKARPILLMTWAYARLDWINNDQIVEAHRTLGRELGVEIAPVALAWQTVLRERPDIHLFAEDREHPSLSGTYLETCVVYATLMRSSPVSLRYVPEGIPPEDAAFLRRVAWETVQHWTP